MAGEYHPTVYYTLCHTFLTSVAYALIYNQMNLQENLVFDTYKNAKWCYSLILQGLRHF